MRESIQPRSSIKGKTAFINYYGNFFGQDINQLLWGLSQKFSPVLRFSSPFESQVFKLWQEHGLTPHRHAWFKHALLWPATIPLGESVPGVAQGWLYPMSPSSLIPVLALNLKPTDVVLDACAAPGGKALAIAAFLRKPSQLVLNDLSPQRLSRLSLVLKQYHHQGLKLLSHPAEKLPLYVKHTFNKILIDAPCSSEAHVYTNPKHVAAWSVKRVVTLQKRQLNLINSLTKLLKPGGSLIYSTCAVTPEENEIVVMKSLARQQLELTSLAFLPVKSSPLTIPELKDFPAHKVIRVMPHTHQMSPMFVASFTKPL